MENLWGLTLAGLAVSIVSALESRVQVISSFCVFFGEGCRKTEDFTLMKIPVSWWGIGYYLALATLLYFAHPLVFWFVMAGFGFELTFLWIMLSIRAFCVFCLLNAAVVAGLVWFTVEPEKMWQTTALVLFFFMSSNFLLSRENASALQDAPEQRPEETVARVNGVTITKEELERPLSQPIYKLASKLYKLKRERLEEMVQDALLKKEAERREVPKQELIDTVLKRTEKVSNQEIDNYCRRNRRQMEAWEGTEEEFRSRVKKLLGERKKKEAIRQFANELKESRRVDILLKKPSLPLTQVDIEGRPALGPADAPVVVVEFSDPFCPACRAAHETTRRIKKTYENRIRWVFKDLPLEKHKGAQTAAEAAHCAEEQGKFWEFQDLVFGAEEKPDVETLKKYADTLGLNREKFANCLEGHRYQSQIENDIQAAKNAGISATPTFIINGKMISGAPSLEDFKRRIEAELKTAVSPTAAPSPKG